jgi:hypothetical protein
LFGSHLISIENLFWILFVPPHFSPDCFGFEIFFAPQFSCREPTRSTDSCYSSVAHLGSHQDFSAPCGFRFSSLSSAGAQLFFYLWPRCGSLFVSWGSACVARSAGHSFHFGSLASVAVIVQLIFGFSLLRAANLRLFVVLSPSSTTPGLALPVGLRLPLSTLVHSCSLDLSRFARPGSVFPLLDLCATPGASFIFRLLIWFRAGMFPLGFSSPLVAFPCHALESGLPIFFCRPFLLFSQP